MTISSKGRYRYGSEDADIQPEIHRYSQPSYEAVRFNAARCVCGNDRFTLETDEEVGAGRCTCTRCATVKLLGDSADYAVQAAFENHVCVCDHEHFAITSAVALYADSNDVRWYYIGCRCDACNLVGVFADWKCEGGDADSFLART
ncbi:hypothetical protein [Pseudomonas piscis]|uniref:hypothetical protein n=1 Tax=Pseudomonas piscis TaxID=2614538 RepID=UPI0021D5F7A8|nr:hypothetical protein [Pseudomonas piscis]MCU7645378.1 hypothetical protein [Pseudomonas piscis]